MKVRLLVTALFTFASAWNLGCGDDNENVDAAVRDAAVGADGAPRTDGVVVADTALAADTAIADTAVADSAIADAAGTDTAVTAATITIQTFTFSPDNLSVAPGSTVTVKNLDTVPHTVTSSATADAFTPGAVGGISFDTGTIASQGTATFTIPATAPHGTVVPYFCNIHLQGMRNRPTITVQ
jgi:plastocyanin